MSEVSQNLLLAVASQQIAGEVRLLKAGEVLETEGELVWFPLTSVIRVETGTKGFLGGWENREGAVSLVVPSDPEATRCIVQEEGYAVVVRRAVVETHLRTCPAFNAAVMLWLARSREDALRRAALNLHESALDRVVRLLKDLRSHNPDGTISICQSEIARLVGVQRTTVCGTMAQLRTMKVIEYSRGRVTMFNPKFLLAA